MHHIASASRESPYYKRLIDGSFSAPPINRLCLLQLAFQASRSELRKLLPLSAAIAGNEALVGLPEICGDQPDGFFARRGQ